MGEGIDEPLVDGKEDDELDFWKSNFWEEDADEEEEELLEACDFLEAGPAVIPGFKLFKKKNKSN